ncbi:plasmid pRiA4b ORF-3 family protein [Actinoplanes utahensis]|uniref:Plasmid pRiA4b Orf3-like domain-containing protein n=1 Tax=Actinoplanes utahensis TaxID=1869 RepID=A0A0A6UKP9_ACTUT|nr:plasmid pRiA4b ORF-3 family protein [Actinoplanes utahensis]KHD74879.1 hypothetical protein MB27_26370 [Actinoplanes utahensis]
MSPVSRGRKKSKSRRSGGERVLRTVAPVPEQCDCPECSGGGLDAATLVGDLLNGGSVLLDCEDPLEAEMFGANFLSAGDLAGEGFAEAVATAIVPAIEEEKTREALAVLLAIGAVDDVGAASDAARRLIKSGVPEPGWAAALRAPMTAGAFLRFADRDDLLSVLVCTFERGGTVHGFAVNVDHGDCFAAAGIVLFPGDLLDQVVDAIQDNRGARGLKIARETLDPGEFRWQVERALDARADHDADLVDPEENLDEDGPGYHLVAALLRARMWTLPEASRPPAEHGGDLSEIEIFRRIATDGSPSRRRPAADRKLPAKRKKSSGPAPIYQIKVSLRGARPPIWRRLQVPADTSLAALHGTIQIAFDWEDSHLHVFETPYGLFGVADPDLGHRSAASVTLEQVAPSASDKITYIYDFGDDWEHEILVEKVLDREEGAAYPRCTGGRRAAPPDDCGGIWGYHDLIEVVADPAHPDHADSLEWLGLNSPADFDPAHFKAADITRQLLDTD